MMKALRELLSHRRRPASQPATPLPEHTIKVHQFFYVVNAKDETIAHVKTYARHGVRWLTDVWVDQEHRRQGLATRLLHEALAAHVGEVIYLTVHGYTNQPLSDVQLTNWYARFGFQPAGAPGVMVRYPDTAPQASGRTGAGGAHKE